MVAGEAAHLFLRGEQVAERVRQQILLELANHVRVVPLVVLVDGAGADARRHEVARAVGGELRVQHAATGRGVERVRGRGAQGSLAAARGVAKGRVVQVAQGRRVLVVGRGRRAGEELGGDGRGNGAVAGHVGDALAVKGGGQGHVHDAEALVGRRQGEAGGVGGRRAVGGGRVGGEGGVDGGDHVVLGLGHGVGVVGQRVGVEGRGHVGLHGQQRAVEGRVLAVDVDAAKVLAAHVLVDDMAVGQDVGEGALVAELAVALCEVLAGRALRDRLVRVQEGTRLAGLARALAVELARDVGGACGSQPRGLCECDECEGSARLLLLLGGLRAPAKPISRRLAVRPPGTAMGPLPLLPWPWLPLLRPWLPWPWPWLPLLLLLWPWPLCSEDGGGNAWWGCSSPASGCWLAMSTCHRAVEVRRVRQGAPVRRGQWAAVGKNSKSPGANNLGQDLE